MKLIGTENKKRSQDVTKNEVKIWTKIPVDIEKENNKQKWILITERTDITEKTDELDEKIQTNDRKKTIGQEQPIRSRENYQQINGFAREQRNNERQRNTLSVKTGTPPVKQKARLLPLHL